MPYREYGKNLFQYMMEDLKVFSFKTIILLRNIICLTKLNSNELYKIQIIINYKKPTSQSYFEKIFKNSNLDWKTIYLLPRIATVDTTIRVFQYKLLNNVLFLNKMLY